MIEFQKLIDDLKSSDWKIQTLASDTLTSIGPKAVPYLVRALMNGDDHLRREAIGVLFRMKDYNSAPFVCKALKDKDPFVRELSAKLLGDLQYEWGLSQIAEALRDEEHKVRSGAGYALAKIGKPSIPILLAAARDADADVRSRAMWNIRDVVDISCLDSAIDAFSDKDKHVREAAMQAVEYLIKGVSKPSDLDILEKKIDGFFKTPEKGKKRRKFHPEMKMRLLDARNEIAKRKNELRDGQGILLDERPKPPNKGGLYRTIGKKKIIR